MRFDVIGRICSELEVPIEDVLEITQDPDFPDLILTSWLARYGGRGI